MWPAIGSLPEFVRNDDGRYLGNLRSYFPVVFNAGNVRNPYHNFGHMMHVPVMCWEACEFYKNTLTPREMRNLIVAGLFHDYDHSGRLGNDDLNIKAAIRGFIKHIAPEDVDERDDIIQLIECTEFPYRVPTEDLRLRRQILRDADMSQAFSAIWIQQVIFGLAGEWHKEPIDILRAQDEFLKNLKFHTEWAQQKFPQEVINAKRNEARELVQLAELK